MAYDSKTKYIDGLSFYGWVSLAVKSVRLGWPEGIRQAEARIGNWTTKRTCLVQIMEDIFPSNEEELAMLQKLVWQSNWDELCSYDTHHGRGLTDWFLKEWDSGYGDYANEEANKDEMLALAAGYGFHKPQPRIFGDLYCWTQIKSKIPSPIPRRSIDNHPWKGVPIDVLDRHTVEGRKYKQTETILSGTGDGHRWLAKAVAKDGWEVVRNYIHTKETVKVEPREWKPYEPKPKKIEMDLEPTKVKAPKGFVQQTLLLF